MSADEAQLDPDWVDVVRAFGRMPYGAGLSAPKLDVAVVDLGALVEVLDAMVRRLQGVAASEQELRSEVDDYRRMISVARDFAKLLTSSEVT